MIDGAPLGRRAYDFAAPVGTGFGEAREPVLDKLVATRAFRRLSGIRFLGGIDYLRVPRPNGRPGSRRYTRYQHSLGVARLALLYCDLKAVRGLERRLVAVAALLHDIGHAPLSHSLEPVFKSAFGIDHHGATEALVTGRVPLGREVHAILKESDIDIERLIAVIGGREPGHDGFFAGPINFDTIEGILRTQTYERPAPRLTSPETVMTAAARRADEADRIAVDEFWSYKDLVYRSIINAPSGILADAVCQTFMHRRLAAFSAADVLSTEDAIFRKLPGLRPLLRSPGFAREVGAVLDTAIRFKARRFEVDPCGDFFARDDETRYRQSRTESLVLPGAAAGHDAAIPTQDVFNDIAGD